MGASVLTIECQIADSLSNLKCRAWTEGANTIRADRSPVSSVHEFEDLCQVLLDRSRCRAFA